MLDTSASMTFGTADRRKWDVAEGVALAVGHVAARRGNRLAVSTFGDRAPTDLAGRGRAPRASCRSCSRCAREPDLEPAGPDLARRRARPDRPPGPAPLDRRRRLGLPRPARLAAAARCASPRGTTWSRSRSAIRASRSCPTSATSGSSTPRRAGSSSVDTRSRKLRRRFDEVAAADRDEVARELRSLGVGARRALDRGRLAEAARRLPRRSRGGGDELRLAARAAAGSPSSRSRCSRTCSCSGGGRSTSCASRTCALLENVVADVAALAAARAAGAHAARARRARRRGRAARGRESPSRARRRR